MEKVYVILWLGHPYVFGSFKSAESWLLEKVPYLSDIEVRMSVYVREIMV